MHKQKEIDNIDIELAVPVGDKAPVDLTPEEEQQEYLEAYQYDVLGSFSENHYSSLLVSLAVVVD